MSKIYYIYEIWGKKIGCAVDLERRIKYQNAFNGGRYEVLEVHTDVMLASQREIELQEQYGYKVDNIPYWKTLINVKKAHNSEVRKKAVANTDYKARTANFDYKARAEKQKKLINQYDLNGNFIKTWSSATEAAEKLNGHKSGIGSCCIGTQKSAYGYKWKYANQKYINKMTQKTKFSKKEYMKEYNNTPTARSAQKAWFQSPEGKAKHRAA